MSEYVFRYANGYGFDADDVEVVEYFAEENTDHYGTLHEEIVRCRDCVYFAKYPNDEISVCYRFDNEQPVVEPDGFCAWAVKRTEAENG